MRHYQRFENSSWCNIYTYVYGHTCAITVVHAKHMTRWSYCILVMEKSKCGRSYVSAIFDNLVTTGNGH